MNNTVNLITIIKLAVLNKKHNPNRYIIFSKGDNYIWDLIKKKIDEIESKPLNIKYRFLYSQELYYLWVLRSQN